MAQPSVPRTVGRRLVRTGRTRVTLLATLALTASLGGWAAPGPQATAVRKVGPYSVRPTTSSQPLTFLIAGVTPRYIGHARTAPENFRGNTDALLLAQVDMGTRRVRTLSIPRDTRVMLPGIGWGKVNSALPRLGPDGLVKAVQNLTGVRIDGYVLVNLQGLRALTDAAGGVSVYVPRPMKYTDRAGGLYIDLRQGVQRLNGSQAEQFVRFRKDALGDVGRAQRQQAYVRALAGRLLTPDGLTRLGAVSRVLQRDVRTNLRPGHVAVLLGSMLQRPRVETRLLPGRFLTVSGISYWGVDEAATRRALASFGSSLVRNPAPPDPRTLRVAIVAAGAPRAEVQKARAALLRAGYRNVFESRSGVPNGRYSAVLSNGALHSAQRVQKVLGFGEARVAGDGSIQADITVWVGRSWTPTPVKTAKR